MAKAAATAPPREPSPPITGMARRTSEDSGRTRSTEIVRQEVAHSTPAIAAKQPDNARIDSFTALGTTPKLATARSLSRTAITSRPGRLRRTRAPAPTVRASRTRAA